MKTAHLPFQYSAKRHGLHPVRAEDQAGGLVSDDSIDHRALSVLLVDDNPSDRAVAKAALLQGSTRRYQFAEAGSAEEAVRRCDKVPHPDCMVLDFGLPDGDALDVLSRLPRDAFGLLLIPVVITTGLTFSGGNRGVLRAGAHDYIGKAWLGAHSLTRALEPCHRSPGPTG
jgi:CheY-like chemotaxis protein